MVEEEESLEVTEEAKTVARVISRRGYNWTDGYEDSFAYDMDSISYFEEKRVVYKAGSEQLLKICKQASIKDSIWEELGLDSDEIHNVIHCCEKIKNIMRYASR